MPTRNSRHINPLRLFTMFLVHHLESGGVTESALRRELKLDEGWLEAQTHEELIALAPRLLRSAQRLADDELLCLHAGECFHFCLAGAGGLAATHAPTPGLALETFGRFVNGDGVLSVESSSTPEETTFAVQVDAPWPEPIREQVLDGFFTGLVAALRAVCGSSFAPTEIRLTRSEPDDTQPFSRALRGPVRFKCERNEAVVPTPELTKASLLYEPLLYEQLRFIADLSTDRPAGTSPLRQLVEQAIRAGDYSIESVSETLQINRRTLQRRLQKEGVTFRRVLNEVRVSLAEKLLLESELTVSEVARRLHYSDDKAFRKAVKAVTGKTPSEIRGLPAR